MHSVALAARNSLVETPPLVSLHRSLLELPAVMGEWSNIGTYSFVARRMVAVLQTRTGCEGFEFKQFE